MIAQVYDHKLTMTQAMLDLEGAFSSEDSSEIFDQYIKKWAREKILLEEALNILSEEKKDKDELLEEYYNDLITYDLREELLRRHLELNVTDTEIEEYYGNNKKDFELKENILQLIFFKLPNSTPQLTNWWYRFAQGTNRNLELLMDLTREVGGNFHRDEDAWLSFNDILKEIPITTYNQESYLNNHKLIKVSDDAFTYFVKITDFRIKNNISPLEREKERIRSIILNKRKVALLKQLEDQIVQDAYTKEKVIIN